MSDAESSTAYTVMTPPETIASDLFDEMDPLTDGKANSSSVPWPGSTFIIRCTSSGRLLTLLNGQVVLAPAGGRGSIHWACVETKGWLGFKDISSGRLLGHSDNGKLRCSAESHRGWENFCIRARPDGGYVLMMTHFERLWHVGIVKERGVEKLAKIRDGGSGGIIWEFVKV